MPHILNEYLPFINHDEMELLQAPIRNFRQPKRTHTYKNVPIKGRYDFTALMLALEDAVTYRSHFNLEVYVSHKGLFKPDKISQEPMLEMSYQGAINNSDTSSIQQWMEVAETNNLHHTCGTLFCVAGLSLKYLPLTTLSVSPIGKQKPFSRPSVYLSHYIAMTGVEPLHETQTQQLTKDIYDVLHGSTKAIDSNRKYWLNHLMKDNAQNIGHLISVALVISECFKIIDTYNSKSLS